MARKSRKNIENICKEKSNQGKGKIYRTAIYVRLSVEDERKIECESVENQIKLLRDYVSKNVDLKEADLYVDRGITGTKFDRPEFNRMIKDMRAGRLDCILVKDLSRLGRNYLETGNYLESIFPIFGIRFISVTDHYDSLTAKASEDGLIVPLKNLINEAYAKDISKKVSSSVLARQKQGKHIAGKPPYGYKKDPEDIHHLIIDESVSWVVVRIYEERIAGRSFEQISAGLNDDGVVSPGKHLYENGYYKSEKYRDCLWNYSVIRRILKNRLYIGDMVQGRTRKALYKGQPTTSVPKEEYIVVEGTHDPIISREVFDQVQQMFEESENAARELRGNQEPIIMPENRFDGLFFCGDCGRKMHYKTSKCKGRRNFYYECPTSAAYGKLCKSKYISRKKLDNAIDTAIRQHVSVYEGWLQKSYEVNKTKECMDNKARLKAEIRELEKESQRLAANSTRLYGDFADGLLSEDDYIFARKEYQAESQKVEDELKKTRAEADHYEDSYGGMPEMADAYQKCIGMEALTKEMVQALVKDIRFFGKGRLDISFRFEDELDGFIRDVKERCGDGR